MIPQANQIYRHFKGNLYRVITVAEHTESSEQLVIYQALYGEFKVFARPLSMFTSEVDQEKYPNVKQKMRFEPVEQMVESVMVSAGAEMPKEKADGQRKVVTEKMPNVQLESEKIEEKTNMQLRAEKTEEKPDKRLNTEKTEGILNEQPEVEAKEEISGQQPNIIAAEEQSAIDPLLEAYLDTDSYRERINILHGLQHRITEHMLNTMAIVIDFELPEGDIQTKYNALNDCLLTKEKYECNRIF